MKICWLCVAVGVACLVGLGCGNTSPEAKDEKKLTKEERIAANLAKLGDEDRKLADAQKFCPIQTKVRLGEMDGMKKIKVDGKDVFVCCGMCEKEAVKDPQKTLATVEELKKKAAAK